MHFQDQKTKMITQAALIAAVYVALVLIFKPISFGAIQFRIAEALCILPFFSFAAVPGLAVGCLLGNFFSGAAMPDVISFGTRISSWYAFRPSWPMPLSCPLFYSMLTVYRTAIPSSLLQWDWERSLR